MNVPGIVGLGHAAQIAKAEMATESARTIALRDRLHRLITDELDEVYLNGHPTHRLPGNLNLSFAYIEGESMLMGLNGSAHGDLPAIAVSSGSACTSATLEPSYVLKALGVGDELAHTSIRFGLGRFNTRRGSRLRRRARRLGGQAAARPVAALRDGQGRHRSEAVLRGHRSTEPPRRDRSDGDETWLSTVHKVIDHYSNPRNVGSFAKDEENVGTGIVGAPECGDVMKLQLKINDAGIVEDAKFKTFGCGSAIASSSYVTELVKGKSVDEVAQIKNSLIVEELSPAARQDPLLGARRGRDQGGGQGLEGAPGREGRQAGKGDPAAA